MESDSRLPLQTRSACWAHSLAGGLSRAGITPNAISAMSLVLSTLGGAAFVAAGTGTIPWLIDWIASAAMVQLRLLCNLMDGKVAIEGGYQTPTGEL